MQSERHLREVKFEIRLGEYSENVKGYRFIDNDIDNHILFINKNYSEPEQREIFYRLLELAAKYHEYGIIILQGDNTPYVHKHYRLNPKTGRYRIEPEKDGNIYDFNSRFYFKKIKEIGGDME